MNRRITRSFVAGWVTVGALVGACGKDDSLGDDNDDALTEKGSGGVAASTGGAKSQTGGTPSKGGANGSGGGAGTAPQVGSGGSGDCGTIQCIRAIECVESCGGPVESSGCCPCPTGTFDQIQCSTGGGGAGGANTEPGEGGAPPAGGSPPATGGSAPTGGAADGMGGSDGNSDPGEPVTDPDATGSGACAARTLGEIIAEIHEANPDLANITTLYDPNNPLIGASQSIHAFRAGDGFRLVFVRGTGDCPAGCINNEYWYFETNDSCESVSVGHYAREYDGADNCYQLTGAPLWNHPEPQPDGACEGVNLDDLNTNCVSDTCPAGLTPDFFYGVAGTQGPRFCMCTIPCEDDPTICPDTTVCQYLADGPGEVCYRP
jgi:hypothetical protein